MVVFTVLAALRGTGLHDLGCSGENHPMCARRSNYFILIIASCKLGSFEF